MSLRCTVQGKAAADGSETDSLAGSDVADPATLREMLLNMDHDGADAQAAARSFAN